MVHVLWGCLLLTPLACAHTPAAADIDRSVREFELAASLRAEGSIPGALQHLERALKYDPDNARAQLLLGLIHLQRRDLPLAETHVRRAVDILHKRSDLGSLRAEAHNLLGVVLVRRGQRQAAVQHFRKAANDPLNVAPFYAWGNLGWAHFLRGAHRPAIQALRHAVHLQPRFCVGHYRLGRVYHVQRQWRAAEKALTAALQADARCQQHYQQAWALRAATRASMGLQDESIADLERCVEISKNTKVGQSCERDLQNKAP
ncbi:MAG: tetratricopeptide repeat protein [Polyangiales bacterium]